jgi:tRNA 2-thiouridine synthesizing protein A
VIRTQQAVAALADGDELVVTCTDPGTRADIPAWCRVNGHQVVTVREDGLELVFRIRVGGKHPGAGG